MWVVVTRARLAPVISEEGGLDCRRRVSWTQVYSLRPRKGDLETSRMRGRRPCGVGGEEMGGNSIWTLSVLWLVAYVQRLTSCPPSGDKDPSLLPLGHCHKKQNDNKNHRGADTVKDHMLRNGNGNTDHTWVTRTWATGRGEHRNRAWEYHSMDQGAHLIPRAWI